MGKASRRRARLEKWNKVREALGLSPVTTAKDYKTTKKVTRRTDMWDDWYTASQDKSLAGIRKAITDSNPQE